MVFCFRQILFIPVAILVVGLNSVLAADVPPEKPLEIPAGDIVRKTLLKYEQSDVVRIQWDVVRQQPDECARFLDEWLSDTRSDTTLTPTLRYVRWELARKFGRDTGNVWTCHAALRERCVTFNESTGTFWKDLLSDIDAMIASKMDDRATVRWVADCDVMAYGAIHDKQFDSATALRERMLQLLSQLKVDSDGLKRQTDELGRHISMVQQLVNQAEAASSKESGLSPHEVSSILANFYMFDGKRVEPLIAKLKQGTPVHTRLAELLENSSRTPSEARELAERLLAIAASIPLPTLRQPGVYLAGEVLAQGLAGTISDEDEKALLLQVKRASSLLEPAHRDDFAMNLAGHVAATARTSTPPQAYSFNCTNPALYAAPNFGATGNSSGPNWSGFTNLYTPSGSGSNFGSSYPNYSGNSYSNFSGMGSEFYRNTPGGYTPSFSPGLPYSYPATNPYSVKSYGY